MIRRNALLNTLTLPDEKRPANKHRRVIFITQSQSCRIGFLCRNIIKRD